MARMVSLGVLVALSFAAEAKDLKRILRAIEKQDYPKTIELIEQSLAEQSINPGVKYVLADLMTYDSLPIYDIDSARQLILAALDDYADATYDDLEELSKNSIGIEEFEGLSSKIESMHYERALEQHEVASFELFMDRYPLSDGVPTFVRLRDSLVWSELRPAFDVRGYKDFLDAYPQSHLLVEVTAAYDSLLFYRATGSDKLEDYRQFLEDHPETPYRDRVESVIFRRMTASNDPADLRAFIDTYDNERLRAKAFDIGYHLDPSFDIRNHPRVDSIRQVQLQDTRPLVPVLIDDKYWFMNPLGAKVRDVAFDRIPEDYICGNIRGDVLIGLGASGGIRNRLGAELYSGNLLEAKDLGMGVLLIRAGGNRLIHKSGFTIYEGLDDAEVVGDQWIKVSVDGQYGLMSISGHPISAFKYDDIWKEGAFWVFERDDLLAVYTKDRIMERLQDEVLELEFKFDDLEVYRDSLVIGFRGDRECLMNQDLDFLIPWGDQEVSPGDPFHFSRTSQGYQVFGPVGATRDLTTYVALQDTDGWMAVQSDSTWRLLNKAWLDSGFVAVDSAHLIGKTNAVIRQGVRHHLLFASGDSLLLEDERIEVLVPLQEGATQEFLLLSDGREQQVYATDGRLIFEGSYDDIKPLNDSLFVVEERGRQGVIDVGGQQVVSQRYEALQVADGMIFLLRDGKIGGYDLRYKRAFANKYESRIEPSGRYYVTTLNGRRGLIDRDEDVVLPFAYEAIDRFNDTIYWVQEDLQWSMINLRSMEPILEEVTRYEVMTIRGGDYVQYYGIEGYGLLNSEGQVLLPPKFNSIQNVGDPEHPILFVEEYSQTADFYVVTYLNREGERLGSFGYRPEAFQRVICED